MMIIIIRMYGPSQEFFTNGVGLPLTMVPNFETRSCSFIFGATPPPLEATRLHATFSKISVVTSCSKYIRAMTFETFCQEDVVFAQACLSSCALVSASSSSPTAARSPTAALATRSEVWASNEEDVCADEVRGWAGGEDVRALAQMELDVARRLQVTPTHTKLGLFYSYKTRSLLLIQVTPTHTHVFEDSVGAHSLHLDDTDIDCDRSKETYYSVKRDLLQCQKRPDASARTLYTSTT